MAGSFCSLRFALVMDFDFRLIQESIVTQTRQLQFPTVLRVMEEKTIQEVIRRMKFRFDIIRF